MNLSNQLHKESFFTPKYNVEPPQKHEETDINNDSYEDTGQDHDQDLENDSEYFGNNDSYEDTRQDHDQDLENDSEYFGNKAKVSVCEGNGKDGCCVVIRR